MKPIEKDLMLGMISILNQAIEANHCMAPIMSDENFNMRLADLTEFEDETGVMFISSPNCKSDIQSIITIEEVPKDNLKECRDTVEISECSNQKEMLIYLDINGFDTIAVYTNGYLTKISCNHAGVEEEIWSFNIPYKINKDGSYIVKGKMSYTNKPTFYIYDILDGGSGNLKNDLNEAKELNFDIVPFWFANNLNPKKLQNTIDYAFDCVTEDGLDCNGVIFKFSEKQFSDVLNFVGYRCSQSR